MELVGGLFGWGFLIFQYIPEREPYQLGTQDTELVNIVTINFAFI